MAQGNYKRHCETSTSSKWEIDHEILVPRRFHRCSIVQKDASAPHIEEGDEVPRYGNSLRLLFVENLPFRGCPVSVIWLR
jgi:hypothetical protein